MSERRYEAERVAALGGALAIAVSTGEYSISEGAERKYPGGRFHVKRVGQMAAHRIGEP